MIENLKKALVIGAGVIINLVTGTVLAFIDLDEIKNYALSASPRQWSHPSGKAVYVEGFCLTINTNASVSMDEFQDLVQWGCDMHTLHTVCAHDESRCPPEL